MNVTIWHDPAGNADSWAVMAESPLRYRELFLAPAMEAARNLGLKPWRLVERGPGTSNPRAPEGFDLSNFLNAPQKWFSEWCEMIRQIQLENAHTHERVEYWAYFRPPSDVDQEEWYEVLGRVEACKCAGCVWELSNDFVGRYMNPRAKTRKIEPHRESGGLKFPTLTLDRMLSEEGERPSFREPFMPGDLFIQDDRFPFSMEGLRKNTAMGFETGVYAHVLIAAANTF